MIDTQNKYLFYKKKKFNNYYYAIDVLIHSVAVYYSY